MSTTGPGYEASEIVTGCYWPTCESLHVTLINEPMKKKRQLLFEENSTLVTTTSYVPSSQLHIASRSLGTRLVMINGGRVN